MAATLQKLKDQGWHLSEDGLKKISDDGNIADTRELVKKALDFDLREISKGGGLAPDYAKSPKLDVPSCGLVLQVQSIRNVSAPKSNEESKTAPRLLQVELSDGQTVCTALELDNVPSLSVNTAPGTKVLLKNNIKLVQGMLMMNAQSLTVIGGHVALMYDKWESHRTLAKYAKGIRPNTGPGGPPPWIPFGQKSQQQQALSSNKTFKSLADKEKGESKENVEFTTMRTDAIAEAMKVKSKKVFGGGNRQLVDYNVKKIIEKGYTEDQAKFALKYARNNLERAMGSLKRRDDKVAGGGGPNEIAESSGRREPGSYEGRRGSSVGGFKDDRRKGKLEVTEGAKPSAKVSLFDFLENKIPKIEPMTATTQSQNVHNAYSNNNNNNTTTTTTTTNRTSLNPFSKPISNSTYRKPDEPSFRKPYGKHHDDAPSYGSSNRTVHAKQQTPPIVASQSQSSHQAGANSSSTSGAPVPSSKNPFSLENRSKFENNMSASFANRQKRDDELDSPPSRINKNFASSKSGYATSSAANQRYQSGAGGTSDSKYSARDRNLSDSRNSGDVRNNNQINESRNYKNTSYNVLPTSGTSYNASANYQQNATKFMKGGVLATEPKSAANRYHDDNKIDRRQLGKSHATPPPSTTINSLNKSTAAMKLTSNVTTMPTRPASTGSSTTTFHSKSSSGPSANAFEKVFPQMPNGFEYNPYKIMGFQNKETNEFAMNVLKSQNFDSVPQAHMVSAHLQPSVSQPQQQQPLRQDAYVPMPMTTVYAARPPPQQHPSQPHFGSVTFQPFTWPHSLRDICFAKYWEDGRYYNAEITGMSDKTCVVQFMDYGNFEEVLLTDCVPITEANIQMVDQYNANIAMQGTPHYTHQPMHHQQQSTQSHHHQQQQPQHHQQQLHHHQNQQHHHHQNQQQQQQRFRSERQMYVPPAQRSTK